MVTWVELFALLSLIVQIITLVVCLMRNDHHDNNKKK